ncbi:MAG: Asp-tRNA(Asn)/Glu-tRNA(Gln) amidotransferase subunit GatC [Gemmatimonadetes bacterium]|nr:Asp-tRNA(Asn)/Glu-tRNA(Gln) amidotransferase subunit GatC [Gemmatimonadota bacterium]
MAISDDDVRHIAALARLGLEPARVSALVQELNGILGHMAVLQRVDTSDVKGATDGRAPLVARPDERNPDPLARPIEQFAPEARDHFFLVPRLGTHDEEAES